MAETGVVVAPAPSARQQQIDKPSLERLPVTTHRLSTGTTNPPLQPIHETNQHTGNNDNNTAPHDTQTNFDANHPAKQHIDPITSEEVPIAQAQPQPQQQQHQPNTVEPDASEKEHPDQIPCTPHDNHPSGCTEQDGQQSLKQPPISDISATDGQAPEIKRQDDDEKKETKDEKKQRDYEETIIDGFAICAFASWEELQDEINERIALERAKITATANIEKSSSNKSHSKKRPRPKKKKEVAQQNIDQDGPGSQSSPTKSKKIKTDKSPEKETKNKKSSSQGQSSKSSSNDSSRTSGTGSKKSKKQSSSKESSTSATGDKIRDSKKSSKSNDDRNHPKTNIALVSQSNDTSTQIKAEEAANRKEFYADGTQQPSTPQVHAQRMQPNETQPSHRDEVHDRARDTNSASQNTPYSPYGSNPHLNRLYDFTNQTERSMQQPFSSRIQHIGQSQSQSQPPQKQENSQSQQPSKPNVLPDRLASSQSEHAQQQNHQYQMPYHQRTPGPFNYPTPPPTNQQQSSPSMKQGQSPYHNPYSAPSPHFYPPPPAGMNRAPPLGTPQPPQPHSYPGSYQSSYASQPQPRFPPQHPGYYPSPQYSPYSYPMSHAPAQHPFSMYPPHPSQPAPHSSSVMSSMSMSAMSNPYGSPYIVTDTTIRRETSIMPPMPSALEQAAASSVASRFGHHPSMIHSMNHYSPTAAAAAAAAAAASHPPSTSMFQGQLQPTDRSFMELARSYSQSQAAATSYPSLMPNLSPHHSALTVQPTAPPTPSSSGLPPVPFSGLDRWPRMSMDQRIPSRPGSLFPPTTSLPDRTNPFGSYGMRPPAFPVSMFPPRPPPF